MLWFKLVEQKNGKAFKRYYMTQGDTFANQLSVVKSDGNEVLPETIEGIVFKLADANYNEEYSQNYKYDERLKKWTITIPADETAKWAIATHVYEYQLRYTSGEVKTYVQERFIVTDQIQGGPQ